MMDGVMAIAVTEAESSAEKETTLEGRLKAAMKATKNHWMLTDEDKQFIAAIAAVMILSDEEEKARIQLEFSYLKTLSAAMTGIPVNFEGLEEIKNPIGLMEMWKNVK